MLQAVMAPDVVSGFAEVVALATEDESVCDAECMDVAVAELISV